jgi:tetratricopeptide (TPR) repeat protein
LVAGCGAPIIFLLIVEVALRLGGFGYPTSFLLSTTEAGRPLYVQNNQFGWRFFGPQLARRPHPIAVARPKPPQVVRVLVLGESAAKGDPDPRFGLPRMLEATLQLRHPGVQFEVVNTAMTAINSHVIRTIARDVTALEADVWVIYLGNNEVVGPFGAGTVFSSQTLPAPVIRVNLALKATRTGQLLDSLTSRVTPPRQSAWGGMEMFLSQQIRAGDPRLVAMYENFAGNLRAILNTGRRAGAGIVLSTVAVNLRDCAPFSSEHRPDLTPDALAKWNQAFQAGTNFQAAADPAAASARFREAAAHDATHAELRFRQAQCALALGETAAAAQHFAAARDLDSLRFRCDAQLNELIRTIGTTYRATGVLLTDAERTFAGFAAAGVPGEEFFYEHVHLTFAGNFRLARLLAEPVEQLLVAQQRFAPNPAAAWPTEADCARRLGWADYWQLTGWNGILPRLHRPPFTGQFDHAARMKQVRAKLETLAPAASPGGRSNALYLAATALAAAPADVVLLAQVAGLKAATGDFSGAVTDAQRAVELLPSDAEGWTQLGVLRSRQLQHREAAAAFRRAADLDSRDVISRDGLALALAAVGQSEAAVSELRRALAIEPGLGILWLHLGRVQEAAGRPAEAAECFAQALRQPDRNLPGLIELAGFCQGRGWHLAAATNYLTAIELDPANAQLRVGAAQNLAAIGRLAEATDQAAEAVRLAPEFAEAQVLHGMVLGRMGRLTEAEASFRAALRSNPNLVDARINLGLALMNRDPAGAWEQFQEVLRREPGNDKARRLADQLRSKAPPTAK